MLPSTQYKKIFLPEYIRKIKIFCLLSLFNIGLLLSFYRTTSLGEGKNLNLKPEECRSGESKAH